MWLALNPTTELLQLEPSDKAWDDGEGLPRKIGNPQNSISFKYFIAAAYQQFFLMKNISQRTNLFIFSKS